MLDAEALLRGEDYQAAHRADLRRLLLRMLMPPVLRADKPENEVLRLERQFEAQVAELEQACNVRNPAGLSVYSFLSRVAFSEQLVKARGGAVQ